MITLYLLEFLFFSFFGWLIDSGYRSLTERRWINAGYFKGPFCPIYGCGGLVLVFLFEQLAFLPTLLLLLLAGLSLIFVEFLGGIFTEKVLKVKLWDYSSSKYHLGSHIDLLHSTYWFLMSLFFFYFLYPLNQHLERIATLPEYLELPVLLGFILGGLWLISRKNPDRFLIIKSKVMNITVERYRELFSNIQRMYQTASLHSKKKLYSRIQQQLRNTGAYLKKIKP